MKWWPNWWRPPVPISTVEAFYIKSAGEWVKFVPATKEDEVVSKFQKALLSGAVRLPTEETQISVSHLNRQVHIDFGERVMVMEPDSARQLAGIITKHADEAEGKT